jgi:hypothetical protein
MAGGFVKQVYPQWLSLSDLNIRTVFSRESLEWPPIRIALDFTKDLCLITRMITLTYILGGLRNKAYR